VGKESMLLPHNVAGLYVSCLWQELIQSTVELRCEHAYGIALDYGEWRQQAAARQHKTDILEHMRTSRRRSPSVVMCGSIHIAALL